MKPSSAEEPGHSLPLEACPKCGITNHVRHKLLLIDEAWINEPGKDPRLAHFAYLRVDDLKPEGVKARPLQQFVDGLFCDQCMEGFVPHAMISETARRYS